MPPHRQHRTASSGIGPFLAATTAARLMLVPVIIATVGRSPLLTTLAICAFIAADVHDGVLARRRGADGVRRRSLDSIVDRLAIDACLVGAAVAGLLPASLLVLLLVRDAYCAAICARMVRARHVAIKADWVHRSLNTGVAVWAVTAPFLTPDGRLAGAIALLVASVAVAWDLRRLVAVVVHEPSGVSGVVLSAGALRHGAVRPVRAGKPAATR